MKLVQIRSEETKRELSFEIEHSGHKVSITVSATCQKIGSASAVHDVFNLAALVVQSAFLETKEVVPK